MKKTDFFSLGIYIGTGLIIAILYHFRIIDQGWINYGLLGFGLGGSLLLYGFYYTRLKNLKVFLVWTIIALIQIILFLAFKTNTDFYNAIGGTYLRSLLYLPILLIVFLSLRFILEKIFKKDLIINMRRYSLGEIVGNREVVWSDYYYTVLGMLLIVFGINLIN